MFAIQVQDTPGIQVSCIFFTFSNLIGGFSFGTFLEVWFYGTYSHVDAHKIAIYSPIWNCPEHGAATAPSVPRADATFSLGEGDFCPISLNKERSLAMELLNAAAALDWNLV